MEIWQIKDRSLRMTIDSLYCKTVVLNSMKSFTRFDWSKEILRLTRETGEIKMGLSDHERGLWDRVWKKNQTKSLQTRQFSDPFIEAIFAGKRSFT